MHQLNPLGSAGSWELSVVLGFATFSYALLGTIVGNARVAHHGYMALAVILIMVGVVINMVASAPRSRDYRRQDFALVVGFSLGAALLQGFASAGGVASIATDWGPLALAGVLAAASPFRPQAELLWAGSVSTVVIGIQKTVEGLSADTPFGPAYFVVTAIAPIMIVTIGQSAYTGYAIRSVAAWQRGFEQTQQGAKSIFAEGLARKVGQDFLAVFGKEVQPLLARILRTGRITASDAQVAAAAAERIRTHLVNIAQQTWLERLDVVASDAEGLAERFDVSSRAAITTLISGLMTHGATDITVRLNTVAKSSRITVHISAAPIKTRLALRSQLAAIFRVLYVIFFNVNAVYGTTSMTVQFDYGVE
ncbi:MAG: hypothetical protein JJE28_07620 [Actinomycetales bacterium]|nr:hypothetical protein [Actinomycetales bacterium]